MAQGEDDIERGTIAPKREARDHDRPLAPSPTFGERLATVGLDSDLFYGPGGVDKNEECHVNLANLHRMMLHGLQMDLITAVARINLEKTVDDSQRSSIRALIREYGELSCLIPGKCNF